MFFSCQFVYAQVKLDDFGRIIVNTYLPENTEIPSEAYAMLSSKLSQVTTLNGLGGSQANQRFIITARVDIGTKDIIAGPPQMLSQDLEITLIIGDALTETKFSAFTMSLKGVGTNETKSFIDAFKNINPKNKELILFLEQGKQRIIDYYSSQCEIILNKAQNLVKQEKYDEAIYELTLVPEVCLDCHFKCLDTIVGIYQRKIDNQCKIKLAEAKATWLASQNSSGAEKVADMISVINPMSNCQDDVTLLTNTINAKLRADEMARWQHKMRQYADKVAAQKEQVRIAEEKSKRDDVFRENQAERDATFRENQSARDAAYREKQSRRNHELDKIHSNNAREVALEFARNQPKTVTYNSIYWR